MDIMNQVADFRVTDIKYIDNKDTCFKINGVDVELHATGEHHAINAAAACAVSSALDLPLTEVAEHLSHFRPFQSRGTSFRTSDNITVLDDTYNAAPDSFRSALQTLTVLAGGTRRTVAVLGDMKELGRFSSEAHRYVGQIVKQRDVQLLITVGQYAREIADEATHLPSSQKHHFVDAEAAYRQIRDLVQLLYGQRRNSYRILFTVLEEVSTVRILHVRHSSQPVIGEVLEDPDAS
ncbi:MAG: hypothetical protein HC769_36810 [Cyanobacteria bacterium CRU_2_1]|nr:hypothetical protein [Microcoleus sp. SU_5_3]NJL39651.1 hypothetical protein [Leptolyngbyaceae cyanobacterium SM1_4_3]NJR63839.1 hypothetical protein [Cyanobacteria bacterium CRU_2_1]